MLATIARSKNITRTKTARIYRHVFVNIFLMGVFLLVLLISLVGLTTGKTCRGNESRIVDIRNSVDNLNTISGCTVIDGALQIVLIENDPDFSNYSFPELREITDYLLFFHVKNLTSLGKLFPNLAVIRGKNLLANYALVVYQMENLNEIGLYNLTRIFRGSVRIERNENLCYVRNINWARILPSTTPSSEVVAVPGSLCIDNYRCHDNCKGYCWNPSHCQLSNCELPCLSGCSKENGEDYCEICSNLVENNRCVDKCSPGRYVLEHLSRCITLEQCEQDHNWFVFNNTCIGECPSKYEKIGDTCKPCTVCHKVCDSALITNIDGIIKMEGCTHINGYLQIRLDYDIKGNIDEELEKYLGLIEEIAEHLKVYRSVQIRSFKFLKNLRLIKGVRLEQDRYSLFVFDNPNLQELWGRKHNIEVLNGTFSFHFNPKLCPSEIEQLAKISRLKMQYNWVDVSNHSNGDSFACNTVNINVTVVNTTTTSAEIQWTAPENRAITQYLIFYKEVDDLDLFSEDSIEEECGVPTWATSIAFFGDNQTVFTWNITDLRTYTNYSYFVRTNSRLGGRSEVQYLLTLSGDPSVPMNLKAELLPENNSAIILSWEPPTNINGVLSHYIVVGFLQKEEQDYIDIRNYCQHKMIEMPVYDEIYIETTTEHPVNNCVCEKKQDNSTISVIQKEDFDAICSDLDRITYNAPRGVQSHGCGSYKYQVIPEHKKYIKEKDETDLHPITENGIYHVFVQTVDPRDTTFIIGNLKHYTTYIILLAACNQNRTEDPQCSSIVMDYQRTGKKNDADDIPDLTLHVVDLQNVELSWSEPPDPNAVIVSYDIIYKNLNNEKSSNVTECITRKEHQEANFIYVLRDLPPGEYILNVRATSLAGPANFSPAKSFKIISASRTSPILITTIAFIVLLVLTTIALLYWYYKIRPFTKMQLIAAVNPEYAEFQDGDKFVILPDDLVVKEELGTGTFGTVYSGIVTIKEEGTFPCAVKVLKEGATDRDQMEFINEATTLRSFNDCFHVVKLLGVCKNPNLMIVMELMERGDLKTYLRSIREGSASLGFVEIIRMAIEIADGMSYLAAKKYVHRDLAARNCMVSSVRTVKIGDFGMTRDIYETDYYRKETKGLLPVRWMSPESLVDGVFTSDSDAWSYGVVLWEVVTYAEQPYQGMSNEQVLQFVTTGGVLNRPRECPDLIWSIINQCFNWIPMKRPLFIEVVELLDSYVGEDFKIASFFHSRGGQDFRRNISEVNTARLEHHPALKPNRMTHWSREEEPENVPINTSSSSDSSSPSLTLLNQPQSLPRSLPNDYSPSPGTTNAIEMREL